MDLMTKMYVKVDGGARGQTMTEYALILSAVAVVVFLGYQTLGTTIQSLLTSQGFTPQQQSAITQQSLGAANTAFDALRQRAANRWRHDRTEHRDGQQYQAGSFALRSLRGLLQHAGTACGVQGQVANAQAGGHAHRAVHRGRDVVQLQIEEDVAAKLRPQPHRRHRADPGARRARPLSRPYRTGRLSRARPGPGACE